MHFLTKTHFILIGLLGTFILVLITILSFSDLCRSNQNCISIFVNLNIWYWANYILFTPMILLFTLITSWMRLSVFGAWKRFAVWAIPVLLVLTYFVTRDTGGNNFFTMDFSLYFLAIIYGLFFLSSLIVIGIAAFRNK